MLDKDYIKEIQALDKKEAKDKLDEYAQTFGIKLKKTRSFDNMVADLEKELAKLADEPMPEDNDGLSIADLIQADDEIEGKAVFKDEASDEAKLLFDAPVNAGIKIHDIDPGFYKETPKVNDPGFEVKTPSINDKGFYAEAPIGDSVIHIDDEGQVTNIPVSITNPEEFSKAMDKVVKIIKTDEIIELPENFSPNMQLLGKNPGYITLPWWIYQWIKDNPDWKSRPTSFEHPSAHQTLFSLIYYIKRNGSVMIRETRNSSFVTLK